MKPRMFDLKLCGLGLIAALSLVAETGAQQPAGDGEAGRYPDWSGQWNRIGSLNWPPNGYERAGPPPLTD